MRDYAETVAGLRECAKHTCCSCPPATKIAADAIKELIAAVPRWISVEERLPEPYQGVLVYDDCGYMCVGCYTYNKHFTTLLEFHVDGEYEPGITHWMPLPPAPPKEDADVE